MKAKEKEGGMVAWMAIFFPFFLFLFKKKV